MGGTIVNPPGTILRISVTAIPVLWFHDIASILPKSLVIEDPGVLEIAVVGISGFEGVTCLRCLFLGGKA